MSPLLKSAQPGKRAAAETRIARGRREEEHFLARREDARPEQVREHLRQPRTAGEHVVSRGHASSRRTSSIDASGFDASGGFTAATRYSPPAFTNCFTSVCTARRAMSTPNSRLEQADLDVLPVHLRITLLERGAIELLRGQLEAPVHLERLIDVGLALLEEEQHADRDAGSAGPTDPTATSTAAANRTPCACRPRPRRTSRA